MECVEFTLGPLTAFVFSIQPAMLEQCAVGVRHDLALFAGLDLVAVDMRGPQIVVSVRAVEAARLDVFDVPLLPRLDPAPADMALAAMVAEDRGSLVLAECGAGCHGLKPR